MKPRHRIYLVIASLSLILLFAFPLWSIYLETPQYNGAERLSLHIFVQTLKGGQPDHLDLINQATQGMGIRKISPSEIKEFLFMPWIVVGLSLTGVLFSLVRSPWMPILWLGMVTVLAGLGLWDLYLWEYDYGHNIDPNAVVKIPGMAYQPPLIGSNQLLDYTTSSYPASGFWVIVGAVALSGYAALDSLISRVIHEKDQVQPSRFAD